MGSQSLPQPRRLYIKPSSPLGRLPYIPNPTSVFSKHSLLYGPVQMPAPQERKPQLLQSVVVMAITKAQTLSPPRAHDYLENKRQT